MLFIVHCLFFNYSRSLSNISLFFSFFILFIYLFIFISWRLITLQYYSGFCHTGVGIGMGNTCIYMADSCQTFLAFSQSRSSICLSMHPFYFEDFESSLISLFWIVFQVDYFLLTCLVLWVFFFHVPSSAACVVIVSFCLIYCVWDLLSAGWKVVVSLNS